MRSLAALFLTLLSSAASAIDFSGNEVFIPVVSRVPGANGTQWRTDVVVTNRDANVATEVSYVFDAAGAGEGFVGSLFLEPMQTLTFTDFVGDKIGLQQTYGTLWLGADNDSVRIAAHARIYNVGNAAGEFGQIMQGLPLDQLSRRNWLHGLIGIRGNRTNVGIGNPNNTPASVSLAWYDKSGELRGSVSGMRVSPWDVLLLNDIFDKTGIIPDEGLTLRMISDVPVYAYASVVRNDTGDAYTIVANGSSE